MSKTETLPMRFIWKSCSPDPVQYKPNNPTLEPVDMQVDVRIPDDEKYIAERRVVESITNIVALTPLGMAYAMREVAKAIKQTYDEDK